MLPAGGGSCRSQEPVDPLRELAELEGFLQKPVRQPGQKDTALVLQVQELVWPYGHKPNMADL